MKKKRGRRREHRYRLDNRWFKPFPLSSFLRISSGLDARRLFRLHALHAWRRSCRTCKGSDRFHKGDTDL